MGEWKGLFDLGEVAVGWGRGVVLQDLGIQLRELVSVVDYQPGV